MAFKYVVLCSFLAVANAGYLGAPLAAPLGYAASPYAASAYGHGIASPALVSQQNNILRTPGNLGQVSTYSKTINTPYSSVSKSDVRVSNDALVSPYASYAAPAYAHSYAAPAAYAHSYAAPAISAYSSPYARVAAAPLATHGYAAPLAAHGYAAPLAAHGYAAPVAAHGGLLGVAYSAAPAVAHISYSNGLGINYAY